MTGSRRKRLEQTLLHANCVAIGGSGVLILGKPGSGKSDLTLRLIDAAGSGLGQRPIKAMLVSDDQVLVKRRAGKLHASPPKAIAGLLEIRGYGIVRLPYRKSVSLALAVRLVPAAEIERLPGLEESRFEIAGVSLPLIRIDPAAASAPARLRAAISARPSRLRNRPVPGILRCP
ncbi:MAG: HPr kinase/phosphorylase [Hyphomicrobiales bacterium]